MSRNLGFVAAVLNVAPWGAPMRAGTVIARGFYIMLPQSMTVWTLVNPLGIGSHLLCLGIWPWALRDEMRLIRSLPGGANGIPSTAFVLDMLPPGPLPYEKRKR